MAVVKPVSYFINNLHNTPSSSNEDKLSFLISQKYLTLISTTSNVKPHSYNCIFTFKPTLAYKNFGKENYNISLLSSTTNETLITFNILSISTCTQPKPNTNHYQISLVTHNNLILLFNTSTQQKHQHSLIALIKHFK